MNTIVDEKRKTFKELETEIFRLVCQAGVELTRMILEKKDQEIFRGADKTVYHSEGFRTTSIKTVYGTVGYRRRVYRTLTDEGKTAFIYLLDEAMGMEKIGLISENLAEKIADLATEAPYRETASTISETTGISISAQGAWGMMQRLGDRILVEEEHVVNQMRTDSCEGEKILPVLFEEMDGTWIRQQGPHHERKPMQEVKVATTYEGWDEDKENENRSTLVGKRVVAGIENSKVFHEKREADIRKHYNADEIKQRIVNGDGGSWISEPNDPDAIIQLDQFHIHKEIRRCIASKRIQNRIEEFLAKKDVGEALRCITIYIDSIDNGDEKDKSVKKAKELLKYLKNNKENLIPWNERGLDIPKPPKGIVYKGMGVQENQNCTVITMRMKHRRMRWSSTGGNNMAKALARKENKELHETISRYSKELIFKNEIKEVMETLSAAKAPKCDGKGSAYLEIWNQHMPILDAVLSEARKCFRALSTV